jgi:hypothetical protein
VTGPRARALAAIAIGASSFAPAGCSKGDTAVPVATVSFSATRTRIALGSPVELTYKFDLAPTATIPGDYHVFVHVLDSDGKKMWDDDHDPPVPSSKWKAGQSIQYTRTKFVPVVPYVGEATVRMGLYRGNERLSLTGADPADRSTTGREYKVGTLQLLPASENIFVIQKNGWYGDEFSPDNPALGWRWTQKSATVDFNNPKKDVTFYLEYDARADVFGDHPQAVTVYSQDKPVETFAASNTATALRRIPITAAQLGANEMAELRIEVDRTFAPARLPSPGADPRELGIRVFHAFIEPK